MSVILNGVLAILQIGILVVGMIGCFQMRTHPLYRYALGACLVGCSLIALLAYLGVWRLPFARFGLNEGISYTLLSGFILALIVDRIPFRNR